MADTQEMSSHSELPNIIWLIADDLGDGDLGCLGHPSIRTVNLDNLASQGVRFRNAFVTTSSCSPSRASFFSGLYPHATGAEDLHIPLPEGVKILPSHLRELGYYSMSVGKFHMGPAAAAQLDRVEKDVGSWRTVLDERPRNRPFFLAVGFRDPHRPYQRGTIADPTDPAEVIVPPYLPDTLEVRRDLAAYYDEVVRMDRTIGRLVEYLEDNKLALNTVVVFFSDNGMPFPRAKTTCYDSGIRTPFIIRYPGRVPEGRECRALFSLVDLAPSMLGLLGVEPDPRMQGEDLSRLFLDPGSQGKEYIHAESNWHDLDDHIRAVRDERYKYIRNYFPRQMATVPLDVLRSPTWACLLKLREANRLTPQQMRIFMVPRAAEELYDLRADPWEFVNLAADPRYSGVLSRLRAECDRWIASTNDVSPQKRRKNLMDIFTHEVDREMLGKPPKLRQD